MEHLHKCCFQRILGITWQNLVPHTKIFRNAGCISIKATTILHQLRWLGHVRRVSHHCLPRQVLYEQLHHGKCTAGGQKKHCKDQLKAVLKKCNIKRSDLELLAAECNTWRKMCADGSQVLEDEKTARRLSRRNTPMDASNITSI